MATTVLARDSALESFKREIRVLANGQYSCRHSQRLYSLPLTVERARLWTLQMSLWMLNRRDCWAFAQGLAPFEVKKLIWQHEEDELAGNAARGVEDHFALEIRQARLLGLSPEDFRTVEMRPGTRTCIYAWIHLVKDSHWLKSVAACAALEISNSSDWVDGGGNSYRTARRLEQELGIPFDKQVSNKEHVEVDVEHGQMLIAIAERFAGRQWELDFMLEGARETWDLERVWKGQLVDMLEELPGPS
jgi:hypothetical protein